MATELKTSRQGTVVPFTIIEGPEDWRAADFPKLEDAILHLTPEYVSELDAAVATAESLISEGKKLQDMSLDDVSADLPTLSPALLEAGREAQWGRGWSVLRGVPVGRYSRQQQLAAYWVLGLHWGRAVPQNAKGHLIGHIKDLGRDPNDPSTRLYGTNAAQPWHNDGPADLVSLLCLSNSEEGGESGWSSSIAVHNEILRRAPHLASVLAGPWFFDRKNEIPDGKKPFFEIPVFNYHKGYLSVNYSDNYYRLSQRHADVPRLTPEHHEAMQLFTELASSPEFAIRTILQPGDVQLLNNHTNLHYRGAFRDSPERTRHLLRLWLAPAHERPLPEVYSEIMGGSVVAGKRGGIFIQGAQHNPIPHEAE